MGQSVTPLTLQSIQNTHSQSITLYNPGELLMFISLSKKWPCELNLLHQKGDFIVFPMGRCFSCGIISTEWKKWRPRRFHTAFIPKIHLKIPYSFAMHVEIVLQSQDQNTHRYWDMKCPTGSNIYSIALMLVIVTRCWSNRHSVNRATEIYSLIRTLWIVRHFLTLTLDTISSSSSYLQFIEYFKKIMMIGK